MAGGAGIGGGGIITPRSRQVPMNLEQALVAATTLRRARRLPTADRCGHLMACPKAAYLYSIIQQVLANNFGLSLLRPLRTTLVPGAGTTTNPRSTGPQGPLFGVTLGSHEERHTDRNAY